MDRISSRLAASIIADRHREAAQARRAATAAAPQAADSPATRAIGPSALRILQGLGRPFGLRSAAR